MPRYNIIDRQGYFGGNIALVYSRHKTLAAAKRARAGEKSVAIVVGDKPRGAIYYGDMYPAEVQDL